MRKGYNGDVLRVICAIARKTALVRNESETDAAHHANVDRQASALFSPPPTASLVWEAALSKASEGSIASSAITVPVSTAASVEPFNERINMEAKRLGFDALELAEVRRRAKLLFTEKHKSSHSEDPSSGAENVGKKKATLLESLRDEVEGCQLWSTAAAARRPTRFFVGVEDARACEKKMSSSDTHHTINGDNDGVNEERIQQLFEVIAVVSAMLYYLHPLRDTLITASATLTSSSSYYSEEVLPFFEELCRNGGIAPYLIAEALVHDVATRIPFESVVQQFYEFIHQQRGEIIGGLYRIQEVLDNLNGEGKFDIKLRCDTLHTLSEEQLVKIRAFLQRELRQQLMRTKNARNHSLEQSQGFLLAWNKYREITGNTTQHIHSRREYRERSPNSNVSCSSSSFLSQRVHVGKEAELRTVSEPAKPKMARGIVMTAGSNHNVISSSCWERTTLKIWQAHREAVFPVLLHCRFSLEKKTEEAKRKVRNSHELGKFVCDSKIRGAVVTEELWHHLRTIVGVRKLNTIQLLNALLNWIRGERNVVDGRMYTTYAVEIVVFLFAASAYGGGDSGVSDDVLLGLERLLQRIKDEYVNDINFATTNTSTGRPLMCLSLQTLTEPLSAFLVDAVFTGLFKQAKTFPVVATPDTAFPPIRWVWGNNHSSLMCVAALLWDLHSPKALNHAVSILRDGGVSPHSTPTDSTLSSSISLPLLQWHAHILVLLTTMVKYGNHGAALSTTVEETPPPLHPRFLLAVVELLNTSVLALLKTTHARSKKPLPRFLTEAVWDSQIPLATWALHHITSMRNECGLVAVCRLVENCQLIINDLTLRWDYSIVPKRRHHKKEMTLSLTSASIAGPRDEYEADNVVADRVVKFASLLEGELLSALDVCPHLFSHNRSFSCMCNAVGIVLYDVDARTSHQIMKCLLRLAPNDAEMDVEAHVTVVRCLASMRHGCTLWRDAIHHYTRAVTLVHNVNVHDAMSPQNEYSNSQRFLHIPRDFSSARVLRCVGSGPISHSMRCVLTLRLVAFARAAGVPLNTQTFLACLQNFTMRRESSMGLFNNRRWCDALQWYDDVNSCTLLSLREVSLWLATCLQSMLAQGEWSEALLSRPLLELIRLHHGEGKLDPYDDHTKVFVLLALCASDRTRSCAKSAKALFHLVQCGSPHRRSSVVNYRVLEGLYHAAIADIPPSIHYGLNRTSRTPLFRQEAPVIPKPGAEQEEGFALQLRSSAVLYTQSNYSHEALIVKLMQSVFLRSHETPKERTDASEGKQRQCPEGQQEQGKEKRSLVQIRERVSRVFPLMQVVWLKDTLNSQKTEENDERLITGDAARSLMDTRYASALIPLRRLEKLRAEKRRGIRPGHFVLKYEEGEGTLRRD